MIVSESQKGIIRTINNGLGGLKETKIIGCEPYFKQNIKYYFEQNEKAATWSGISLMLPRTAIETILVIFLVSFICISLFAFKNNFEDSNYLYLIFP